MNCNLTDEQKAKVVRQMVAILSTLSRTGMDVEKLTKELISELVNRHMEYLSDRTFMNPSGRDLADKQQNANYAWLFKSAKALVEKGF